MTGRELALNQGGHPGPFGCEPGASVGEVAGGRVEDGVDGAVEYVG